MRALGMSIVLALVAAVAAMGGRPSASPAVASAAPTAQAPAAPAEAAAIKTFANAADVQALLANAKANRKEGQVSVGGHVLSLDPYYFNLEYRAIDGPASVHEKEAELIYVLDGTATLITGGTVVNEKRTNPTNLTGTGIEGGTAQTFSKGDVTLIPEGTPHQFKPTNGALVLMTMHVPRPVPNAQ
jgi:mannose-6-phosphate isomerase-like protein (cupin superfamily)